MNRIFNLFIIALFLSSVACGSGTDIPNDPDPKDDPAKEEQALSLEEILLNNLVSVSEGEGPSFSELNLSTDAVKFLAENVIATTYIGNFGLVIQSAEQENLTIFDNQAFDYITEVNMNGVQGIIAGKVHGSGNISDESVDGIFEVESNLNGFAIDDYYVFALTGAHQSHFHVQGSAEYESVEAKLEGTFAVTGWLGSSKVSFKVNAKFPVIEAVAPPTEVTGKIAIVSKDQTYLCDFDGKNFVDGFGKTITTGATCQKIE